MICYSVWSFNYYPVSCACGILLIWLLTITFDCCVIWIIFYFIINCYPICVSIPLLCVTNPIQWCVFLYLPIVIMCHTWLGMFSKCFRMSSDVSTVFLLNPLLLPLMFIALTLHTASFCAMNGIVIFLILHVYTGAKNTYSSN